MNEVELGAAAFWYLLVLGSLAGALSIAVAERWTDMNRLRVEANNIIAYLLEFRLFADDPFLVWQAQRKLFLANGRFLRLLLFPTLLLALPFAGFVTVLDGFFANAPLRVGEPAVVTAEFTSLPADAHLPMSSVAVRVLKERQISWRITPDVAGTEPLKLNWGGRNFEKSLAVGEGLRWISTQRDNSWLAFLRYPHELPFSDAVGTRIRVQYPKAVIFGASWLAWFIAAAFAASLLAIFKFEGFRL
jgi:hypothetical protein